MEAAFSWLGQAAPSYDEKLALARQWDRELGPYWLVVDKIKPSTVREVVRITVRDPETAHLIVQRDLEQRPLAVEEARGYWTSWAVDQVLLWRRPSEVRTECPPGAVRWTNSDTGRDECFSCAPPLVTRVGADGRPYCRRTPALTQAPPRRPPVLRYQPPRPLALRGAPFEWLGAPVVPIQNGVRYTLHYVFPMACGQLADADVKNALPSSDWQSAVIDRQPLSTRSCLVFATMLWTLANSQVDAGVTSPSAQLIAISETDTGTVLHGQPYTARACLVGEVVQVYPQLVGLEACAPSSAPCQGGAVATQLTSRRTECVCPPGQQMQLHDGQPKCAADGAACPTGMTPGTSSTTGVRTCTTQTPPACPPEQFFNTTTQQCQGVLPSACVLPHEMWNPQSRLCECGQGFVRNSQTGQCDAAAAPSSRPRSSSGIFAALAVLGVAVAIFAATVRGTRVGVTL